MALIEQRQIEARRCALLDRDFISNTYSVQNDGGNRFMPMITIFLLTSKIDKRKNPYQY